MGTAEEMKLLLKELPEGRPACTKRERAAEAELHGLASQLLKDYEELKEEAEHFKAALASMAKDGCGGAVMSDGWKTCPERGLKYDDWCWSCQAAKALKGTRDDS